VADASGSTSGTVVLDVGGMDARIVATSQPRGGLLELPMAHLVECRADRRVVLDDGFIPTALSCRAAQPLCLLLTELLGLVHQRGEALAARDIFALTAMHPLITLGGSLVTALALAETAVGAEAAFDLTHLDELWQAERWGEDHLAAETRAARRRDFMAAARLLTLL
jgi:hypothetical protein